MRRTILPLFALVLSSGCSGTVLPPVTEGPISREIRPREPRYGIFLARTQSRCRLVHIEERLMRVCLPPPDSLAPADSLPLDTTVVDTVALQ
ncbi:MAG TPA: hypothetical protein VGW38_25065 [Chloroflexota bacterium]|nr:hypothetical protein [Chloroflexota bacterium]